RRQGMRQVVCERPAALARALDNQDSKRRELRRILDGGNLSRERALGMLALALRPVPVPFDAGWGKDRSRLYRLVTATDPATAPGLRLLTPGRALPLARAGRPPGGPPRGAVRAPPP